MTASAFVVEDHPVVRAMVAAVVARIPGVAVCGTAASAEEALPEIERLRPRIVLVDLSLPGASGLELVKQIRARFDDVACVVLTGHAEPRYRERALAAGSQAYVLKDDPDELTAAIEAVLSGGRDERARP